MNAEATGNMRSGVVSESPPGFTPENQQRPHIPESQSVVDIAIIDTSTRMGNVSASTYQGPSEHYPMLSKRGTTTPSYSFYIVHQASRTKLLFDLGLRVDWKSASSPVIRRWVRDSSMHISVEDDVAGILQDGGVALGEIDAVIFSHQHFDHTGDIRKFPANTKIIVGPGYKEQYLPGWPRDKKTWETTSDLYDSREVLEVNFTSSDNQQGTLKIGRLDAYDYFGDGSFYLLNTPGHTVGHLSALARTTSHMTNSNGLYESTFILLGGDVAHNCALIRPSPLSPLPHSKHIKACNAGSELRYDSDAVASIHYANSQNDAGLKARTTPFCCATGPHHDVRAAQWSIDGISELDGMDNVLTILAHDATLHGVVSLFPHPANDWESKGWREKCRWGFLERLVGSPESLSEAHPKAKM